MNGRWHTKAALWAFLGLMSLTLFTACSGEDTAYQQPIKTTANVESDAPAPAEEPSAAPPAIAPEEEPVVAANETPQTIPDTPVVSAPEEAPEVVLASAEQPQEGQARQAVVDHVIHISVDGLNAILLGEYLATAPERYPTFVRLTKEGAYTLNARTDFTHTITLPNHTAMLTGRPVRTPDGMGDEVAHRWEDNGDPRRGETLHNHNPYVDYISSTFDVAHDAGLFTRHFANKTKFLLFNRSFDAEYGAPDTNPVGGDNGKNKIDANQDSPIESDHGAIIGPFIASLKETPADKHSYTFLHIADCDGKGHGDGWGSPQWRQAVADVDGYLKQILDEIDSNEVLNGKTAVVITADHGGIDKGHGQSSNVRNYTIPVFVWGVPSIPGGTDVYQAFDGITDPGEGRPDFNDPNQPIRNGSTGNLSMMLLGLDPIPGSIIFTSGKLSSTIAQQPQQ